MRRIHKVQDYIEENLTGVLILSDLADVAGFSKYHFHRIFGAMMHETPLQYVNRIKLERAAFILLHRPEISVTDIAYHFGFTGSASFSRSFKRHYGSSPLEYRNQDSKNCKDPFYHSPYNESAANKHFGSGAMNVKASSVDVVEIDSMRVIYTRYTGSYPGLAAAMPDMMERLYSFAAGQNLLQAGKTQILTAYHDNLEMTDEAQLRTSLCITIANLAHVDEQGDIGSMEIWGKYAVGHFELTPDEYPAAWRYMYGEWLPNSGKKPRDAFPFEVYVSEPAQNPGEKQQVDIYLPVEPLGNL